MAKTISTITAIIGNKLKFNNLKTNETIPITTPKPDNIPPIYTTAPVTSPIIFITSFGSGLSPLNPLIKSLILPLTH